MRNYISYLVVLLSVCNSCFAQSTISGKVLDSKTNEPLPFANVFLDNSTHGTATDMSGVFKLSNLAPGSYDIIFSFVGYQTYRTRVILEEHKNITHTVKLLVDEKLLEAVEVRGTKDKTWERQLTQFKKIFLGEGEYATRCQIVNPWVLEFEENNHENKGFFKAKANYPIEINNLALGYKVVFYMKAFTSGGQQYSIVGNSRFEELKTSSNQVASQWASNRKKVYSGSVRHLLKAMIDQRVRGEGFRLYNEKKGYPPNAERSVLFAQELNKSVVEFDSGKRVTPGKVKGEYKIYFGNRIEVHFTNAFASKKFYQDVPFPVGWIETTRGFIEATSYGVPLNSTDVITSGYLNTSRIAEMLPDNFSPTAELYPIQTLNSDAKLIMKSERLLEEIHLQTDKSYYYPGEVIWYKGFLRYHFPEMRDSLSKVLYVELIDPDKSVIQMHLVQIDSGKSHGAFILPDTLDPGSYYLRAYTNWLMNYPKETIFYKPIPILASNELVLEKKYKPSNQDKSTKIEMQTSKSTFSPREKIDLVLQVTHSDGTPVEAEFSVSVTDAEQVIPIVEEKTIFNSYPDTNRYIAFSAILKYPMEQGISIAGQFLNDKGKPEKATVLVVQGKMDDLITVETDELGHFQLTGFHFYDSVSFSFQAKNSKGKPYGKVILDEHKQPDFDTKIKELQLTTQKTINRPRQLQHYELSDSTKVLDEIVVTAQRLDEPRKAILYGKADYVVKADQIGAAASANLLASLQGKVPGLQITWYWDEALFPHYTVRIRGGSSSMTGNFEPLLLVDGVPVHAEDLNQAFSQISATNIDRIEIITRATPFLGARATNGVIAVYTKTGSATSSTDVSISKRNFQLTKLSGYNTPLQFKSPDYSKSNEIKTDFRSTIYWIPYLRSDKKGKCTFSFYAADLLTKYRIVAEGLTTKGEPCRVESIIDIGK